jgi:Phosphotransferase enzyme family
MTGARQRAAHPSLRWPVGALARRWEARADLARAVRLVPAILERMDHVPLAESTRSWSVQGAKSTEAQVAVLTLAGRGEAPGAVLKVALTAEAKRSLKREATVVAALSADARLRDWRRLLPAALAEGEIDGSRYVLERALAGHNAASFARDPWLRRRVQTAAAEALRALRERTAVATAVDTESVERWLARPLDLVRQAIGSQDASAGRGLERVAAEVRATLVGHRLMVGWVHGDFWLGNLLVTPDGGAATGILDWDCAGEQEPLLIDLLHLVVYTRRPVERRELGGVVRELLRGGSWSDHELSLLESSGTSLEEEAELARGALLLYWLRHLAANLLQSDAYASNRLWLRRNVDPVLRG